MNTRRSRTLVLTTALMALVLAVLTFSLPAVRAQDPTPTVDGRLDTSPSAPFAIFCDSRGIRIWKFNSSSGRGDFVLNVSVAQVVDGLRLASITGQNVKVGESGFISMWALNSSELQATQREPGTLFYNYIFPAERCGGFFAVRGGPPVPTPQFVTPGTTGTLVYVVQPGDTLFLIATRHGTSTTAIMAANRLNGATIFAGQRLFIPAVASTSGSLLVPVPEATPGVVVVVPVVPVVCGETYTVQRGDTIYSIGRKCGLSPQAIMSKNGVINPNRIFPGQILVLPIRLY